MLSTGNLLQCIMWYWYITFMLCRSDRKRKCMAQEKRPAIVGSLTMENNIRYYIKAMALRISTITQLGYPPINAVLHFMARLNTKTHPPLYKTYLRRYGFCNTMSPYNPPHHSPFSLPLYTSRFTKRLNNAFNNKMGTHDSKMRTSSNIKCKNSLLNHPIHG